MKAPWRQQWRATLTLAVLLFLTLAFAILDPSCQRGFRAGPPIFYRP